MSKKIAKVYDSYDGLGVQLVEEDDEVTGVQEIDQDVRDRRLNMIERAQSTAKKEANADAFDLQQNKEA